MFEMDAFTASFTSIRFLWQLGGRIVMTRTADNHMSKHMLQTHLCSKPLPCDEGQEKKKKALLCPVLAHFNVCFVIYCICFAQKKKIQHTCSSRQRAKIKLAFSSVLLEHLDCHLIDSGKELKIVKLCLCLMLRAVS